ncbi:hypothetical protein M5X66_09690 [Providencia sp. PROV188]|uniref:hypothetical protein n=1 Tax=Providencia sp. PROV188 TaxID=2939731 RepID=UPI0012B668D0|nr:hypothetical protein [Providencia sp. wls1919]WBM59284.1 hypothetical protein M5X66_09690 [Providencia sp. PROV188]
MSDKKEVTELSIKVSVDTTGLDKLEAQLKRITGLMVDAVLTNAIEIHQPQEDLNRTVDIIKDQDKAIADAVRKVAQKAAIDALRNNAKVV